MQALATIYEVAFKSRGRDAAAAFRGTRASPAPGAAAGGGNGGAANASAAGEGGGKDRAATQEGLLERTSAASDGDEASDGGGDGASRATTTAPPASLSSSMATLQQNALVQEMLGVRVRRSTTGSSSGGSGSESSSVVELEDELSVGRSGPAEGDAGLSSPSGGYASSFFPWRARARSRSMSRAESEVSSLTDAQEDYQAGFSSWGPSPARGFRPGSKVDPFAAAGAGEGEEGGCSSGYQSSELSTDSWGEAGRETMLCDPLVVNVASSAAAAAGGGGGGGGASVAGMTHVSGSSGASSTSSLVSDGGRSIVTESDWREWQVKKDAVK
jgi:hypothetical protein